MCLGNFYGCGETRGDRAAYNENARGGGMDVHTGARRGAHTL